MSNHNEKKVVENFIQTLTEIGLNKKDIEKLNLVLRDAVEEVGGYPALAESHGVRGGQIVFRVEDVLGSSEDAKHIRTVLFDDAGRLKHFDKEDLLKYVEAAHEIDIQDANITTSDTPIEYPFRITTEGEYRNTGYDVNVVESSQDDLDEDEVRELFSHSSSYIALNQDNQRFEVSLDMDGQSANVIHIPDHVDVLTVKRWNQGGSGEFVSVEGGLDKRQNGTQVYAFVDHAIRGEQPDYHVSVFNEHGSGKFSTIEGINGLPHGTHLFVNTQLEPNLNYGREIDAQKYESQRLDDKTKSVEKYFDQLSGRMMAERAKDLSDEEIKRTLSEAVLPKFCIDAITHLRDHDGLTIDKVYGSWATMANRFHESAVEATLYTHTHVSDISTLPFEKLTSPNLITDYLDLVSSGNEVTEKEWKEFIELHVQREVTPDKFFLLMQESTALELEIAKGQDTPQIDARLTEIDAIMDKSGLTFDMDTGRVREISSDHVSEVVSTYIVLSINNTNNAAFIDVGREEEIARILRDTADKLDTTSFSDFIQQFNGGNGFSVRDLNGNTVGEFKILSEFSNSEQCEVEPGTVNLVAKLAGDDLDLSVAANILRTAADQFIYKDDNDFPLRDVSGNTIGKFSYQEPESLLRADVVDMKAALAKGSVYLGDDIVSSYSSEGFRFVVTGGDYAYGYHQEPEETVVVNAKGEIAPDDGSEMIREVLLSKLDRNLADSIREIADGALTLEEFEKKHYPTDEDELSL